MSLGGAGNWKLAAGAAIGLKNAGGDEIRTYCLLDKDYRDDDELAEIGREATRLGLQLHVWNRKEIENYLIVPAALKRLIAANLPSNKRAPTEEAIAKRIELICDQKREAVLTSLADATGAWHRKGVAHALGVARRRIERAWETFEGKTGLISGKELLSELSAWSKEKYGVSFSRQALAKLT